MNLTYRKLRDQLNMMPEERLDDNVTIFDGMSGECSPSNNFGPVEEMDPRGDAFGVLDDGHFTIKIRAVSSIEDMVLSGDAILIDASTPGCFSIVAGKFGRLIDDAHASVILPDHTDEIIVELANIYLGEHDKKSLADMMR